MHDFKKHLETRLKRLNEQRDGIKEAAKRNFKSMKTKAGENEKLVTLTPGHSELLPTGPITQEMRAEEISCSLSNLKKEEKSRAKKIQDIERQVQVLHADLANPIQVEDMSEIDEEMACFSPFATCTFLDFGTASPQSN